ncbi:serine hydrolase [Sphingomonas metalli]|uniref:Serine hydrolase n=2 Tax=Sphingomonas metalli TaxID=1779358 RepID=A0A916TFF8_9SPHN|nr:serine hydrolase [Sphingomonas metalli]
MDAARLDHLCRVIEADLAARRYHGAVVRVARGGRIALDAVIGHADADRARPLAADSVFTIFSTTKAFTNVLALRAVELGRFALTTAVSEVIPEFDGGLRAQITVFDLLTHSSGLPMHYAPQPGMALDDLDAVLRVVFENVHSIEPAGDRVNYSPMYNQLLLGEMLRRTDPAGRGYREIIADDLFAPLGMDDTAIGVRADLQARHIVPDFQGHSPIEHRSARVPGPNGAFEDERAEMPWVGAVSTVPDLHRFAEMLRRRGTLDGARILSPVTMALATRNWTGDKPNELYRMLAHKRGWTPAPAGIGLGFTVRTDHVRHHMFGTLTAPGTFGNYGAGSALFWIDPVSDVSFVCLTAGLLEPNDNILRFQRLSDIVASAVG